MEQRGRYVDPMCTALRKLAIAAAAVTGSLMAQTKLPPAPADYGQWETLVEPGGGGRGGGGTSGLSPDGKWLVYGINRSNGNDELRVANVATGATKTAAFGSQPVFSADSHWLAFSIGYSETQTDRMRRDSRSVENKLGLMNLTTGEQTVIDSIQSFSFSPTGTWLAMRHYPPEAAGVGGRGAAGGGRGGGGRGGRGGGANGADDHAPGTTLIARRLSNGRDMTFGNVSELAWQDEKHRGTLLAMAISTPDKTGNGLQLFDTQNASIRVLDSSSSTYSNLAWRKDSADLAALKSKADDKRDGSTYILLAWRHLGEASETASQYDPTGDAKFPASLRTVAFRRPTWSDDGATLFLGLADWYAKPAAGRRGERGRCADSAADSGQETADEAEDRPAVQVWHWRDNEVMAYQAKNADQDGKRNMLAAWHLDSGNLTQLGHELSTEQVTPIKHRNLGLRG
jgi:hypothetical protein